MLGFFSVKLRRLAGVKEPPQATTGSPLAKSWGWPYRTVACQPLPEASRLTL